MTLFDEVLYDYQKVAAKRIQETRRILLADQPGLGKTLEVLAALELDGLFERPTTILIASPIVNAQTTWRDSIERFVGSRYKVNLLDVSKGTAKAKEKALVNWSADKVNIILANHTYNEGQIGWFVAGSALNLIAAGKA